MGLQDGRLSFTTGFRSPFSASSYAAHSTPNAASRPSERAGSGPLRSALCTHGRRAHHAARPESAPPQDGQGDLTDTDPAYARSQLTFCITGHRSRATSWGLLLCGTQNAASGDHEPIPGFRAGGESHRRNWAPRRVAMSFGVVGGLIS